MKTKKTRHSPTDGDRATGFFRLVKELNYLKAALNAASLVVVTDAAGRIVKVNDLWCRVSGFSRKDLVGKAMARMAADGDAKPGIPPEVWADIAGGKVWRGEMCCRTRGGGLFWVEATVVPFMDEWGAPQRHLWICAEITQRKVMEEAVRFLPQRIIQAQESERHRISNEIHDDLGQSLASLKLQIQSALAQWGEDPRASRSAFAKIIRYLDRIIEKTRNIAAGLRPSSLETLGLTTALRFLIDDFRGNKRVDLRARLMDLDGLRFRGEEINLYRIVQEALSNALTHARPRRVVVRFRLEGTTLVVTIRDDGRGFVWDPEAPLKTSGHGLGLETMQERAKLLQGEFRVVSAPRRGTTVTVRVPVVRIPSDEGPRTGLPNTGKEGA